MTDTSREALIQKLRWAGAVGGNETCTQAADMLDADAALRTQLARRTVERGMAISMCEGVEVQQVAVPAKLIDALLHQIDIGDFMDSHGHSAKMLSAVRDLMKLRGRS
jgi:hypothetical protein